jgi:uncharacterized tellurite resistance protein B-like protein
MDVSHEQRRTLIALACKMAWADGVVQDDEREQVQALVAKIGGEDAVTPDELDRWLDQGGPEADLSELPKALGEMFLYEAMELAEADGDMADAELSLIGELLARLAKRHDKKTPLAKIALKRRAMVR